MSNIANLPTVQAVDTRYTQDVIPILDTSKFEHMQRVAMVMAKCKYVPDALREGGEESAIANCFLIVNQAVRWGMDPFALAQTAYVHAGRLGYEGKTIAAAINADPRLKGRLNYEFSGAGEARTIVVSGTFRDTGETKSIDGTVAKWRTKTKDGKINFHWQNDPDQMLVYRGTRQWARRWMPDRLLGIYSDDELDDIMTRDVPTGQRAQRAKDITPASEPAPDLVTIPDELPEIVDLDAEPNEEAECIAALKGAINTDMLEHIRSEQYPDLDWSDGGPLDQAYAEKYDALRGVHA